MDHVMDVRDDAASTTRAPASSAPTQLERLQRTLGNAGIGAALQREADGDEQRGASPVLDIVGRGGGSPMSTDVRSDMESSLGADFGDVRIHTGGPAASSAAAVGARAYTVGNDVVFNDGAYDPHSTDGRKTLAHELTHVVQQRSGPVDGTPTGDGIAISDPGDRFEREAVSVSEQVVAAGSAPAVSASSAGAGASVQREAVPEEEEQPVQALQREAAPEEEEQPVQALQREEAPPEEEEVQTLPVTGC